ncbi:MAG: ATP-binding cassette domain-containing protein [Deltaproteobacteria bacterium]|nr:ATP-binding cassette domain-containing protein [Deltaproteobacteria bacterium]
MESADITMGAHKILHLVGPRGVRVLAAGVVVTLVQSAAEIGFALYLQAFLVVVGVAPAEQLPAALAWTTALGTAGATAALVALGALRSAGTFLGAHVSVQAAESLTGRLRALAVHELLFPSLGSASPSSDAQLRLGELGGRSWACVSSAVAVAVQALVALVLLSAMLLTAWRESLVVVAGVVLAGGAYRVLQARVRRGSARHLELQRAVARAVERVTRNRLYISLTSTEPAEEDRLLVDLADQQRQQVRNLGAVNALAAVVPLLAVLVVAAVVFVSRDVFATAGLRLLVFLYLALRFLQAAQGALAQLLRAQTNLPALRAAAEFLAAFPDDVITRATRHLRPAGAPANPPAPRGLRAGEPRPPAIALRDVAYAYGADEPVLSGLTCAVDAGGILALAGPSGAGKTTALMLVLGALQPRTGEVLVDGVPATRWRAEANPRVGYVGPEPFLVLGDLVDNLAYGLGARPSDDEVRAALRFARLEELAGRTRMVSEELQGLSAGQKQRLCLARAWLARPDLLVLDEPTANVDAATENEIAGALQALRGTCTVVMATHREALWKVADRVVDIQKVTRPG